MRICLGLVGGDIFEIGLSSGTPVFYALRVGNPLSNSPSDEENDDELSSCLFFMKTSELFLG
jgi:hypothetical protein